MVIYLTTYRTTIINDIGLIRFTHPTTNYILTDLLTIDEIKNSADLQTVLNNVDIFLTDIYGNKIYDLNELNSYSFNLEIELKNKINSDVCFANIAYSGGNISTIEYTEIGSPFTVLYRKTFNYTAGVLTSSVLTRVADSRTLTTTYVYSSGSLIEKIYT